MFGRKMSGRGMLLVFFLLGASVACYQGTHGQDYKYGPQDLDCSWKCVLFTLQWPGGFCQSLDNKTECLIPPNINNWTIHGLWPIRAQNCCRCWPMFESDVQELEAELNEVWPSLLKTRSSFHFWKDEWKKHGACAACVEGMNSPPRYFQTCLKLRGRFLFHKLLEDAGIAPSCEKTYKVADVHSVLAPHLGDKHEIQCVTDDKDREIWFQVKIRLAQNLTLGCDHHGGGGEDPASQGGRSRSPGHPCPPELPLYYWPIDHRQPKSPCA